MYRATGALPLEGLNNVEAFSTSPGLFDECISVQSSSFQGQYCSAFFQTEIVSHNNGKSIIISERNGDENTFKLPRVGFCLPSYMEMEESRIDGVGHLSYYDVYWNNWNTLYHLVTTNRQHIFRTTVTLFSFFLSFKIFYKNFVTG